MILLLLQVSKRATALYLLAFSVVMSKLLIVNFNRSHKDSVRIKVENPESLIELNAFHSFLSETLDLKYSVFTIDRLDSTLGKFVALHDIMDWKKNHITILINEKDTVDNYQLCIQGRSFDLSKGLSIGSNGYVLRIKEVEQASLGTGLNTWDGSVILAKYLETHPHLVQGMNVLELGAGTGVTGIAAGLLGARRVVLTDLEYTLDNLRRNVADNEAQIERHNDNEPTTTYASCDDFSNASQPVQPVSAPALVSTVFSVAKLDWADPATYPHTSFDLVVGADIVWLEHLVPDLVRALTAVVGERTTLLLSHQTRSERTDRLLFDSLQQHFHVQQVPTDLYHPEFRSTKINIFTAIVKT